jgi:hypothetical protein
LLKNKLSRLLIETLALVAAGKGRRKTIYTHPPASQWCDEPGWAARKNVNDNAVLDLMNPPPGEVRTRVFRPCRYGPSPSSRNVLSPRVYRPRQVKKMRFVRISLAG